MEQVSLISKNLAQFARGLVEIQPLRLKDRQCLSARIDRNCLSSAMRNNCAADSIRMRSGWKQLYLSRDVFSQITAASTAQPMRFQLLMWETARLVDTFCIAKAGKSRRMQRHRSFAEKSRQMSPWSRRSAMSRVGRSCQASRQSGRTWQTLSVWHATHLCHRAT